MLPPPVKRPQSNAYLLAIGLNALFFFSLISGAYFELWSDTGPLGGLVLRDFGKIFFLFFTPIFCFNLSYLIIGEMMQSDLQKRRAPFFIDLARNLVYALPILVVFTLIILILLATRSRDTDTQVQFKFNGFSDLFFHFFSPAFYIGISMWVYLSLAKISFSDYSTIQAVTKGFVFLKRRAWLSLDIYSSSGILLLGVVMAYGGGLYIAGRFFEDLNLLLHVKIIAGLFSFYILTAVLSRQISFLFFYIREKYPELGAKLEDVSA